MAMLDELYNDGKVQGELMGFPGFRFYPTEQELVGFYLKKRAQGGHPLNLDIIIPTLDLYQYDPWELPGLANDVGEKQWFFFVPRDHKKSCPRPNRLTVSGYWKATGSDRAVRNERLQCIGLKKILVFYKGKAPLGQRTEWIMNEYRMPDFRSSAHKMQVDVVLCKIYRKAVSQKSMEERAMPDYVQREEPIVSRDELYEEKSHSTTVHGSFQISNPFMTESTEVSSLRYDENQKAVWSSALGNTDEEEGSLFECLESIMFCEESLALKNPKAYIKPPQLELPKLSIDCLLSQPIASPFSLLSSPSMFHICK